MKKENVLTSVVMFAAIVIIATALMYGVFAFGNWTLNPGEWDIVARGICALILTIIYLCSAIVLFLGVDNC
jgi:hypothetical protein